MDIPPAETSSIPLREESVTGVSARFAALWPEWTALVLYAALVGFSIPYHEPWADEAQAWQLARSLSLHDLFHTYLRYEGSPGLWHLLLWIMARLHISYSGMHWTSGCIAVAGVAILLLCAPFHRYIKLLLPFTYFLAFQYAVVARNYVLVPLLLFAIAARWRKSPVVVALLLGLLGNVALHALAISGGLAIVYIIERRRANSRGEELRCSTAELITASGLLAILYVIAVWTMLPPTDVYVGNITAPLSAHGIRLMDGWKGGLVRISTSLLYGITEPMPFAIPFWIAIVYALHKRHQTFYLIPAITFALCSLIYLMFWHAGLVVPMMITILWIAGVQGPKLQSPTTSEATVILATVIYLFVVQLGWTAHAVLYDHDHDYSPDRTAAEFLKPYVDGGNRIAVTYFGNWTPKEAHAVGLLPYFSDQIYLNLNKPFWWWSTQNTTDADFDRALLERPPIILMEYFDIAGTQPFESVQALSDPKVMRISTAGYSLTHVFCGEQPIRFTYGVRICHVIFQRGSDRVVTRKPLS